jgi:transcriptional regulator with XRE-family HTH domain
MIGAQLAAGRETRELSVEAVASKLMLSRGQVLGLEQADTTPFYNTEFFLRGLRKYMAFVNLPADLLEDDEEEEEEGGLRLLLADMGPGSGPSVFGSSRNWMLAAAATALLVVPATGAYLGRTVWAWWNDDGSDTVTLSAASLLPAQPIREAVVHPPPVHAEPASAVLAHGDPDATVRVTVGKSTWVFIRYPDNRVVERRLAAGEELDVGPLPVFLAVGTADSVEVLVENRPVALAPYIRNGQVRMTQPELAKLVP